MEEKLRRKREQPGSEPFVDPGACRSYATDALQSLDQRIAKERAETGKAPAALR